MQRLPGHSLALVGGVRGDTLVALLDEHGIAVAAGSACASGEAEPSHVLAAMGLAAEPGARRAARLASARSASPTTGGRRGRRSARAVPALRRPPRTVA